MSDVLASLKQLRDSQPDLEIVADGELLAEVGHDWWMRSLLERRTGVEQRAAAVVRPASTAEVSTVLAWADATRTAVVPFGLGSGVCGAIKPGRDHVVIDMRKMTDLVELNDNSLTVTVQPGMRGSDFEAALGRRGYTMGHFPQSIALSTVGGWCATRASGQLSTRYGNIEDMLLGCEVVLPGGAVVRVPSTPRSSIGPDLRQVFLGSEGTLGIFTEMTFRIHPTAESSRGRCFTLPSLESGIEALRLIMRGGWRPAVTRLYDATEAGRNFQIAADGEPVLLLMSEGPTALVEAEAVATREIVENHGGIDHGPEPVDSWLDHRNNVPSFDDLVDQGLVVDTIEVAIGWDRLAKLFKDVVAEGSAIEGMLAMSGHISHCYTQGGNIYFTFVATQSDPAAAIELYDRVWELTMKHTHELGGTIAHHHGIGRVRKGWLTKELGGAHDLLVRIKQAIDPNGIMNPGVLLDSA